ncbi:MAG: hypothetical protein RL419_1019 [Actinomycetota bacterium]
MADPLLAGTVHVTVTPPLRAAIAEIVGTSG